MTTLLRWTSDNGQKISKDTENKKWKTEIIFTHVFQLCDKLFSGRVRPWPNATGFSVLAI